MTLERVRLDYAGCRRVVRERLEETAPSRIQLLTGPRQVGKTTLLLELAEQTGSRAIYAAADAPDAVQPGFWDRVFGRAAEVAGQLGSAVLFLDEVQVLPNWSARLKGEWDRIKRLGVPIHVVATGSSALGLGHGSKESLTGRFERLTMSHWTARATADAFDLAMDVAVDLIVQSGVYPGAMSLRQDRARWAAHVRDAIVEPAIGRDILALTDVRRPALLRQVFAIAAASPAQIVSLQKLQGQLQDRGALETLAHYLNLLEQAYLVAPLEKYSARATRQRAAPPKLIPLNNAFCAVADPLGSPDPERDRARFGAWVENACLSFAWNSGQQVRYWREEPLEVDAVTNGSWGPLAIEVKTRPFGAHELTGLFEFCRRYPEHRPLVLCNESDLVLAERFNVSTMSWRRYLVEGPGV